ncbi:formimidoylglutamate deiminase [Arsenicicoccus dermatophilus]|uniref:formimidoylglutamate deiminase n=1 Tax=Arsenicicoccus dermatophilus TaxID=1076331 RepID=UPI001F4D1C2B|nr:formimidoylglutamate deiminase [Arsenicicoccus dermatophilus]MCH8614216.1 formimidoylglutamate deiminase [Arsenicicoccus dermatophilus]
MTTFWAEHAQLPSGITSGVRIQVSGDRISAIEVRTHPRPGDTKLQGVTFPGMADAHSHAFHRALRGRTHASGGDFWTWRERMYAVMTRLTPDNYRDLARAVFAEMVLAGFTTVGEFHYVHHQPDGRPYADPNEMGHALREAASDAGIRLTLLDTCYLTGGLDGGGYHPLDSAQRRFGDGSAESWAGRVSQLVEGPEFRVGAAIHSVRAVPRDQLTEIAEMAGDAGGVHQAPMPLHVHLSEQLAENAATLACYGRTPTQLLAEEEVLSAHTTAVHATHLTEEDIRLLGDSGTGACFCPLTERDLADGIGPAYDLHRAGSPLSIGTDQHVAIDPWGELRSLEMHERLVTNERGRFTPLELATIGTENGYRALGWPDGGRLEVGALADLCNVRLDSVRTVGAKPAQVLYAATSGDVDTVVVGGRVVVEGGYHRHGSVALMLRTALDQLLEEM